MLTQCKNSTNLESKSLVDEEKQDKEQLQNNAKATVFIWLPEDDGEVGHVSLKIEDKAYISFWPLQNDIKSYCYGVAGEFCSFDDDRIKKTRPPDKSVFLRNLNTKKMLEKYYILQEKVALKEILWVLCPTGKTVSNCSDLTMQLLLEGGIKFRLPSDAQFGSLSHLTLLCSSRVYITISFLACGLYPILDDMATDNNQSISIISTLLMVLLSNSMIFILEKKLRDTRLIEINTDDYIVGIGSSLGFGSVALLSKWFERTKITNVILQYLNMDGFLGKTIFDTIFLLFGTLFGLYAGGKISSFLINFSICRCCRRGMTYTVSPTNVYTWLNYVERTENIPKEMINFVHKTNRVSLLFLYTGWIACFLARNGFFISNSKNFFGTGLNLESGIPALYIGLPTGIMLGYALTKCYIKNCIQKIKKLGKENYKTGPEYNLIVSNNWNIEQYQYLEKYSLTTATTLLGLMTVISIFDFFSLNDRIIEKGILSPFGAVAGFLCGSGFSTLCQNYLCKKPLLIETELETLSNDEMQTTTSINETELQPLLSDKNTRMLTSYEIHKSQNNNYNFPNNIGNRANLYGSAKVQ